MYFLVFDIRDCIGFITWMTFCSENVLFSTIEPFLPLFFLVKLLIYKGEEKSLLLCFCVFPKRISQYVWILASIQIFKNQVSCQVSRVVCHLLHVTIAKSHRHNPSTSPPANSLTMHSRRQLGSSAIASITFAKTHNSDSNVIS